MAKKPAPKDNTIAVNRRASFDYELGERFEAGIVLQGWEAKSLRAKKASIAQSYVIIRDREAWLFGAQFVPLTSASTHVKTDPERTRKLLLHRSELNKLIGAVEKKGHTLVPLRLFWRKGFAKLDISLAKGKKQHDKRHAIKERDWKRDQGRLLRKNIK